MAEFDPNEGTVAEVNEYLDAHPDQTKAVMAAEQAGQARKGILEGPHATQDDADAEPDAQDPEVTSDALEAFQEAQDKGYDGDRFDQTPLDAYTLEGVTTSDEAARADASPGSPTADGPPTPVRDGSPESTTDLREQDQVDETQPAQED
jgi:hypothetical protein